MIKSKKNKAYIIAEIGQNHQGDFEMAKRYIKEFSMAGADAIKFQKRDMNTLFLKEALEKEYNSENSFGRTYGEHRNYLEFDIDQMYQLKKECDKYEVDFMCTAFDEVSLNQLEEIETKVIKIASFDMGNIPFLDKVAEKEIPFILSAGGSNEEVVKRTIDYLNEINANFSILHCVSRYPARFDELCLGRVENLKKEYPDLVIGLSDHFNGTLSGALGYIAGARIFEKHVTFDRSLKGTDHSFALTLNGFQKFVRDINRTEEMMKDKLDEETGNEYVFKKLGKVLIAKTEIKKGDEFTVKNLDSIISAEGIPVRQSSFIIGNTSEKDYKKGEIINA
ncbi:MAG: N-acetylneuraminate synthase family protein [Pseudomonadota bacterium]|nr:N-acetylneuraminate synthase family protein [Pseudomonadota bacterium]